MTDFVRETLHFARELLRAGDLARAEALYRDILRRDPAQPESLHSLGRIALRTGRNEEALPLIQRAVERRPGAPQAHADLAIAFQNLGRNEEAVAAAGRAIALDPQHLSALNTLGNALRALRRPAEAVECFRQAIALDPDVAVLHLNLAVALRDAGRFDEAAAAAHRARDLAPDRAEAALLVASLARGLGRLDEAEASARRAIELDPERAESHHVLGRALFDSGKLQAAEASYRRALELRPEYLEALYNLGHALESTGRSDEARDAFGCVVALAPEFGEARARLARTLLERGRHEEAYEHFSRAAALLPDSPEAQSGLGDVARALGRVDEAAAAYARAVKAHPEFAEGYANLSTVALDRGALDEAEDAAWRALAVDPALADAHWNLAQVYLTRGDLARGFREYEHRFFKHGASELAHPHAVWDGESLAGRTLFVTAEQGVGDEILFASCLPDAIATAAGVVVECDPRLVPIFTRSFPEVQVIGRLDRADAYPEQLQSPDVMIAAGSLPRFFRADPEAFPTRDIYLVADPANVERWRERFASLGPGLTVGISWRGGKEPYARRIRSIPLSGWAGLAAVEGIHLIRLQYGDVGAEVEDARREAGVTLHHWADSDPLADLDGLAAQMAALDLVISIDNATVHLAGALGVETWVLLPAIADWRWMREREDSPWYASVRLFRQSRAGDWSEVLERARIALERRRRVAGVRPGGEGHRPALRAALPRARRPVTRACLVNDTSYWYHWGCTATSGAIVAELESRGYAVSRVAISSLQRCREAPADLKDFDDDEHFARYVAANPWLFRELATVDHVVINGEGTLHGLTPQVRNLLYLAWVAKTRLGKDVQILNHSCYPEGVERISDSAAWSLYLRVYQAVDQVVVREPRSLRLLERAAVRVVPAFDCLPLWVRSHPVAVERRADEIVLAGSVALRDSDLDACATWVEAMAGQRKRVRVLIGANQFPAPEDREFAERLAARVPGRFEVVEAESLAEWLETLARAALIVSGRFHHTIAAAALGTRFVLLASNTPKNAGLAEALGAPEPLALDHLHLADELEARALEALGQGGPARSMLADLCAQALRNFDGLPAVERG